LSIGINPNPVPLSSQPIPNCSLPNTWTYEQVLSNDGGADITISDRSDFFDGVMTSSRTGLGIVIHPGSNQRITTQWCSANATEHHTRTDFAGSDASGNRINVTGPTVTLAGR